VTYEISCAPFLALGVLQPIADEDCFQFKHVRNALRRHTYVDDICFGADTVSDVLSVKRDFVSVLVRSGLSYVCRNVASVDFIMSALAQDYVPFWAPCNVCAHQSSVLEYVGSFSNS